MLWVVRWLFKLVLHLKDLLQYLHENGLSSVWIRACSLNLTFDTNALSHLAHLNGLSSLCVIIWVFKYYCFWNFLRHISQSYVFSSCVTMCLLMFHSFVISLLHIGHAFSFISTSYFSKFVIIFYSLIWFFFKYLIFSSNI